MSKRYTTPGPWTMDASTPISDDECNAFGSVTVETGPLVDTRTGARYPDGAKRVVITGPPGRPRSKTFMGELAWSDAARYGSDAVVWLMMKAGR